MEHRTGSPRDLHRALPPSISRHGTARWLASLLKFVPKPRRRVHVTARIVPHHSAVTASEREPASSNARSLSNTSRWVYRSKGPPWSPRACSRSFSRTRVLPETLPQHPKINSLPEDIGYARHDPTSPSQLEKENSRTPALMRPYTPWTPRDLITYLLLPTAWRDRSPRVLDLRTGESLISPRR